MAVVVVELERHVREPGGEEVVVGAQDALAVFADRVLVAGNEVDRQVLVHERDPPPGASA